MVHPILFWHRTRSPPDARRPDSCRAPCLADRRPCSRPQCVVLRRAVRLDRPSDRV